MHPALQALDHRPWPIPSRAWSWRQNWKELLFAHWPVPAEELRPLVPAELDIQEFGGTSYIGVVPFRMTGVMLRLLPDLPGVSAFPELNVRLYVERDGKPGVWFLSLDAANRLAVWAARRFFHLPYQFAKMEISRQGEEISYHSIRREKGPHVEFQASWRPTSEEFRAQPGSLDHFLVERYCLYAKSPAGQLYRGEIHHGPWPLRRAEANIEADSLLSPFHLSTRGQSPILHCSRGVEVVVWGLDRIA